MLAERFGGGHQAKRLNGDGRNIATVGMTAPASLQRLPARFLLLVSELALITTISGIRHFQTCAGTVTTGSIIGHLCPYFPGLYDRLIEVANFFLSMRCPTGPRFSQSGEVSVPVRGEDHVYPIRRLWAPWGVARFRNCMLCVEACLTQNHGHEV